MLKRSIIFILFSILAIFVSLQAKTLFLSWFTLAPLLIFPIFYLYHSNSRFYYVWALLVSVVIYSVFLFHHPTFEMFFFGLGWIVFCLILVSIRLFWMQNLGGRVLDCEAAKRDLDSLREKHRVRIDSLDRLEKQVMSLMELFEIARDFSGALRYEVLCKVIYEEVLPEVPFQRLELVLIDPDKEIVHFSKRFFITEDGVHERTTDVQSEDREVLAKVCQQKELIKTPMPNKKRSELDHSTASEQWNFPLIIEDKVSAVLVVEGANADDFVKFEVLASQLVLQVKKITLYETVLELSILDGLTGVYVRRYFLERIHEELKRSIKFSLPLAVLMLDIDHFKRYNDKFGHLVGDETLKEVADLIRQNLRKVDIVARYGGEEFIAVLPESQPQAAYEVAERIRSNIARHTWEGRYDTEVTVSIGISTFPADVPEEDRNHFYENLTFDLIRHADKALYRAKEEGRNRVFRYEDL